MCRATPDVDLTKNPKSVGKDLVKGAKNALPDVSAVPTREEIIANVTPLSVFFNRSVLHPEWSSSCHVRVALLLMCVGVMSSVQQASALTCPGCLYAFGHSACTQHALSICK